MQSNKEEKIYISIGKWNDGYLILDYSDFVLDYLTSAELQDAQNLGFKIQNGSVSDGVKNRIVATGKAKEYYESMLKGEPQNNNQDKPTKQKRIEIKNFTSDRFSPIILDNVKFKQNLACVDPAGSVSMSYVDALVDKHESNIKKYVEELTEEEYENLMRKHGLLRKTIQVNKDKDGNYHPIPRYDAANLLIKKFDTRDNIKGVTKGLTDIGSKITFIDLDNNKDIESIISNHLCFIVQQRINGTTGFVGTNNKQILDALYGKDVVETIYAYGATQPIVEKPKYQKTWKRGEGSYSIFSGQLRVKNDKDEPYVSSLQYTCIPIRLSALAIIEDIKISNLTQTLTPKVIISPTLTFEGKPDTLYYNQQEFDMLRTAVQQHKLKEYFNALKQQGRQLNDEYINITINKINKMSRVS